MFVNTDVFGVKQKSKKIRKGPAASQPFFSEGGWVNSEGGWVNSEGGGYILKVLGKI